MFWLRALPMAPGIYHLGDIWEEMCILDCPDPSTQSACSITCQRPGSQTAPCVGPSQFSRQTLTCVLAISSSLCFCDLWRGIPHRQNNVNRGKIKPKHSKRQWREDWLGGSELFVQPENYSLFNQTRTCFIRRRNVPQQWASLRPNLFLIIIKIHILTRCS